MSDERVPTGDSIRKAERPGPRALRPLRHREYRLLIASGSASLLADGLWLVALVWQVIEMGGGPSDLSVVATATSLGLVVAVLMGGVAADRFPKRAVLVGVEVVRTVVPLVTGVLALVGALQVWQLAALAFVVGAADSNVHQHQVGRAGCWTISTASSPDAASATSSKPLTACHHGAGGSSGRGLIVDDQYPDQGLLHRGFGAVDVVHGVPIVSCPRCVRNRAVWGVGVWLAPLRQVEQDSSNPPVDIGLLGQVELGKVRVDVFLDGALDSPSASRDVAAFDFPWAISASVSRSRGREMSSGDLLAGPARPMSNRRRPWDRSPSRPR